MSPVGFCSLLEVLKYNCLFPTALMTLWGKQLTDCPRATQAFTW